MGLRSAVLDSLADLPERAVNAISRNVRRRRIDQRVRRHAAARRLVVSSGLVGDDEIVDAYDLPDGVAVVVAWPPYGEANCGQYLIDRHGQLYAMPHEMVDTEFCRRYPTRRQRARFAVTERCAASDDGVVVPFPRTALAEQATW